MSAPRTLIFGTSYVADQQAAYAYRQWADLVLALNPGAAVLAVDSASPCLPRVPGVGVLRLDDNIGHLGSTGRDGWGRAFCKGLHIGLFGDYDRVAHIETDVLFARPVAEVFAKMEASGVKAAAPMAYPHQFVETGLMFFDGAWLRGSRLAERYAWDKPYPRPFPEERVAALCGDALFALPLRGMRNDSGQLTAGNMRAMFPYGMDWLTHAEPSVRRAFVKQAQLPDGVVVGDWTDTEYAALQARSLREPLSREEMETLIRGPRRHPYGPDARLVAENGEWRAYPSETEPAV
jgi:hypothetical protein